MLSLHLAQLRSISTGHDAASNLYRARDGILNQIAGGNTSFQGSTPIESSRYNGVSIAQNNFILNYVTAWQDSLNSKMKKDFESPTNSFNTFA